MQIVTVHEAKTHMSRLLARVEAGEEFIIARGKTEIAKLVPLQPPLAPRRKPNRFAHLVPPGKDVLEDGFWDALPTEHLGLGTEGEEGFKPLALTLAHGDLAGSFASSHQDPWDRLLAAQAKIEDLALVTNDPQMEMFGIKPYW